MRGEAVDLDLASRHRHRWRAARRLVRLALGGETSMGLGAHRTRSLHPRCSYGKEEDDNARRKVSRRGF